MNRVLSGGQSQQMTGLSLTVERRRTATDRYPTWTPFGQISFTLAENHTQLIFFFVERFALSGKLIDHDNWAKTSDMDDVYDARTLRRMSGRQ